MRLGARPAPRRLAVTGLDARSVFRLSLALYLAVLGVTLVGWAALWTLLSLTGVLGNIEGFIGELLGYEDFEFLFWRVLQVFVLIGLVWVLVAAATTTLVAALYNRVSRMVGGVDLEVDER